jgi:hypothetical protein
VIRLERFSERYQPTGGLAAEGVLNQLGRPDTEPLEVLVREAVQNCWDAGRGDTPVEVEFGFRSPDEEMLEALREGVLDDPPPSHPLARSLDGEPDLLYIADFGTSGLGGPTRADAEVGSVTDFIDFVRNVGQPPDKELGGGSFGYGKAAFYLASRARTIIVDTHCSVECERRLIAYGLGDHYRADGTAFTGRHWWGVPVDGVPEPLIGEEAEELAASLGLPRRDGERYGTTVAIVDPYLTAAGDDTRLDPRRALEFIGECLLWNFWPKMAAAAEADPAMSFTLLADGEEVPLAEPRTHPRLSPFVEAMDLLRDGREVAAGDPFSLRSDLHSQRPRQLLGTMAVRQTATAVEQGTDGLMTRGAHATVDGLHHIALMRNAELVVRYEPGPVYPVSGRGYAGVFRCDRDIDEVFRRSEPPTHDAWISKTLPEREERVFVNVALKKIDAELREMTAPRVDSASAGRVGLPVGRFADQLAGLMPGLDGPGARRAGSTATGGGADAGPTEATDSGAGSPQGGSGESGSLSGGSGASGPRITELGSSELRIGDDGGFQIWTPFTLDTSDAAALVSASVEVLTMDGGQVETEPPIGATVPHVLGWRTPEREIPGEEEVSAMASESGDWEVWVTHEPDLMVRVAIDVGAEES